MGGTRCLGRAVKARNLHCSHSNCCHMEPVLLSPALFHGDSSASSPAGLCCLLPGLGGASGAGGARVFVPKPQILAESSPEEEQDV